MNKIPEASTLVGFLGHVKEKELSNYISRGESRKHNEIVSSAFREKSYNINSGLNEFYNCICNELTDVQKQHFLAFAQHYGLPTNLIDFSTSPLVALFFACYDVQPRVSICPKCKTQLTCSTCGQLDSDGYVYFLPKYKLLPIDDVLVNTSSTKIENTKNIIADIIDSLSGLSSYHYGFYCFDMPDALRPKKISDEDIIHDIYDAIISLLGSCCVYEEIKEIFQPIFKLTVNNDKTFLNFLRETASCISIFLKNDLEFENKNGVRRYRFLDIYNSKNQDIMTFTIGSDFDLQSYTCEDLIKHILGFSLSLANYTIYDQSYLLPFYCTYTPPNALGRIYTQHSIFVYQTYFPERSKQIPYQKIVPDYIIRIKRDAKEQILKDLDMIGINPHSIFGDYDNIAKHIKNKLCNPA